MKITYPIETFKDHEITVIIDTPEIQRFKFSKPGTWMYGFFLTCSDNLIILNGDINTLVVEPGYGRNGLAFLRGSVNSTDYFLGKVPYNYRESLVEYKQEYAIEDMEEWHQLEYINDAQWEDFKERLSDEDGQYGQSKYYELCSRLGIEEPPRATRMSPQTILQVAGLMAFIHKLDKESDKQKEITK